MEFGGSKKSVSFVMTEAVVVGAGLISLYWLVDQVLGESFDKWVKLFVAGFIFHLVFEWSGINLWYALEYCRLAA